MEIKDKIAVITGASKGIGRAIAIALAKKGAHLAISARTAEPLQKTAQEILNLGCNVYAFVGDMSLKKDIKAFIEGTVQKFNRIDILINNAGVGYFHRISELTTAQWDKMFNLNVRGAFIATRESLPHLRQHKESVIVNVVSLAGKNTFVNGGGYTATKHALLAFSKCLMLEERHNGVRVLAICPGSVYTDFSGQKPKGEHITQPVDVAESILHMIKLPQRAMVSEIDIRPTNP